MSNLFYNYPHGSEIVNIYMTNNIIDKPEYKQQPLRIGRKGFYYIDCDCWKDFYIINDKAYIKIKNLFIRRNKVDHQILNDHCYDDDIFYVSEGYDYIEDYYSPTKLKINKEYKKDIKMIPGYNVSYIEDAIKVIKTGEYKNIKGGTLVKYSFSLKNGVYNDGDLLVYNDDVYYIVSSSLPLDVKLIEFKTIFGRVDYTKKLTKCYLTCPTVSNDTEEYYNKLNDERKKEFLIDLIEDYTSMNNVLEHGACRNEEYNTLFVFKEVIKMIPEYFNKLCDSFYCYNYFHNSWYFQKSNHEMMIQEILKIIPDELKEYFNNFVEDINIYNEIIYELK